MCRVWSFELATKPPWGAKRKRAMSQLATSRLKSVFDCAKSEPQAEATLRRRRGKRSVAANVVFHEAPSVAEELVQLPLPTFYDPRSNALEPDNQGSVVTIGSILPSAFGGQ